MTPTEPLHDSSASRPDLRQEFEPDLEQDAGPDISVVINTCDRCVPLRSVLYALRRQTYRRFEVVVVVGPTHDDTLEMLDEEFSDRVHVARCAEFNLSVSRNVGVRHAAGEVLAFIDDDSVPATTWLEQLAVAYAAHPQAAGVGGRTYLVAPDESESGVQFLSGLVSVLAEQDDVRWNVEAPPKVVPASTTPDECWYPRFHGTNMSYRRAALVELGGFDERFEYLFDDADTAVRFGLAGRKLMQLRQGVVYHVPASGRNRGDKSRYDLNYYCWLRSTIYFCLKNGRRALGLRRGLWKALRHTSHFYTVVSDLVDQGEIGDDLRRKILPQLRRGWREGFWTGLFGRRYMPADLTPVPRSFLPFLSAATWPADRHLAATPLVGPRSQPVKTLDAPPQRIALLSVGYPPSSTEGVARSTESLARGLVHLGHEVHVVTLGESRRSLLRDGVYVHEIRSAPRRRYAVFGDDFRTVAAWLDWSHAAYDEVRDLLLNHRIQVVDTPLWNLDGLVTAVAGDVPVVTRVVTAMRQIKDFAHGEAPEEYALLGDLEGELLARSAAVVSNTRATARTLERIYDFDTSDERHDVVLYGIEPVDESRLAPDEVPDTPDSEDGEVRVLFVGRLESRKGILDLFDAIPEVLAKHSEVRFVMAGSDNSAHDGFRETHGSDYPTYFARRHPKLAQRVDFLGYVPDEDLDRLYRDCDLLVAPSLYESFGLIYLEAMNYARPAIGCRAGGPQEIIVDGETGRLVPPGDGAALAAAICDVVALGPSRRELGRAGRRRLLEAFTHVTMAAGFESVYRQAVERFCETESTS